jgi:hypothetical protein
MGAALTNNDTRRAAPLGAEGLRLTVIVTAV